MSEPAEYLSGGMIGDPHAPPPLPCENHVWGAPEFVIGFLNGQPVASDRVQVCCVCAAMRAVK